MNTSIEETASQSTCGRSESTMSVQPTQSPQLNLTQAPINYNQINSNTSSSNNNNNNQPQQHQQTPQKQPAQADATPVSLYSQDNYHYATPGRLQQHQQYDLRSLTGQQQRAQYQTPPRRGCSGVDKLILAAMIDDAQAGPHGPGSNSDPWSTGFIPSGRGIGYFAGQRDNYAQIPSPSNRSEFELYRLLERANLLNYFGTFLNFGGDDVQQLCDADEEEFLEIMSLVGMTQKPLHVRRLQKALIEWRESRDMEISLLRSSHLNYLMSQPAGAAAQPSAGARSDPTQAVNGSSSVPPVSHYLNKSQSMRPKSKDQPTESNQYIPPRDLLIGAPKRIRLLDSLNDRQCIQSDQVKLNANQNPSPFKNRFNSSLSSSSKRRSDDRSDEDGSDEEGHIEVIDSSEGGEDQSEDDENDSPKSRKLTRAYDNRGSPIEVAQSKQRVKDNDSNLGHRKAAPSRRSHSDLADTAGQRADYEES